MKTGFNNARSAVRFSRLVLYLFMVAIAAFLCILTVHAGEPEKDGRVGVRLEKTLAGTDSSMSVLGVVNYQ